MMDYEAALISKVVLERCMSDAIDQGVAADLFSYHKAPYEFVSGFWREHGASPPQEAFEQKFPDFELVTDSPPISYIVGELRRKMLHNVAATAMKEMAVHLKAKDPEKALVEMRKAVMASEIAIRSVEDLNLAQDPELRVRDYDRLVESGGVTGMPTMWPGFDEVTQGFHGGDLIVFVGKSGLGKTWVETILARWHWCYGKTPGLFTFEMGAKQIARRFDAVHAGLPYQRFRSGQLSYEQYELWKSTLKDMQGGRPFWVIADEAGTSGVSAIEAKIDQYGLDIAYIDGAYLIDDEEEGESGWQRIANVFWSLKRLARRKKIPIIVSHQFNKDAKGDKGSADDLAYSDVQKWADLIVGMYRTDDLRLNKEMLFRILKQREGEQYEWVSEWDLERMTFMEKRPDDLPEDEPSSLGTSGDKIRF